MFALCSTLLIAVTTTDLTALADAPHLQNVLALCKNGFESVITNGDSSNPCVTQFHTSTIP